MKNIKNTIGLLFVTAILFNQALPVSQEIQNAEVAVEQVDKKMSLLDQIMQQVHIIVTSEDKSVRLHAKKELTRLMKHTGLDLTIKEAIESDIEIIKSLLIPSELDAAYQRLVNTYNKINAQANIVDATIEAIEMVENASPEELAETIEQAKQKIEQAEQEQGFLGRMYTKAKRLVTAPVDYVFGKEASYAKTAFYTAVGLAVLAVGGYGVYQYANANGKIFTEKRDYDLEWFDEMIEKYSQSPEDASINQRYSNEVIDKSAYQIEKYVHERKKELKQKPILSDRDRNTIDAQLHALSEFSYFFFEKNWTPGGGWRSNDTVLLRDSDNLSKDSLYLKDFAEIMQSNGSRSSLVNEQANFESRDWYNADRQEILRTLQQYNEFITENEKALSEKTDLPTDTLYKSGLSDKAIERVEKLEQSMKKPTFLQQFFLKEKK